MWVQVAGALAEAGVGLKEITARVSEVAKAMGECQSRDWGVGGLRLTLGLGAGSQQLHKRACQVIPQGLGDSLPLGPSWVTLIFCNEESGCLSQ